MAGGRRYEDDTIRIPKPAYEHGAVLQSETGDHFQIVARRFTMNGDRYWEYRLRNVETGRAGEWRRRDFIQYWPEMGDDDFDGDEYEGPDGFSMGM